MYWNSNLNWFVHPPSAFVCIYYAWLCSHVVILIVSAFANIVSCPVDWPVSFTNGGGLAVRKWPTNQLVPFGGASKAKGVGAGTSNQLEANRGPSPPTQFPGAQRGPWGGLRPMPLFSLLHHSGRTKPFGESQKLLSEGWEEAGHKNCWRSTDALAIAICGRYRRR